MRTVGRASLPFLAIMFFALTTGAGAETNVPADATKNNPYKNSFGMKFVPVPGTDVLFGTTEMTVDQYRAAGLGYRAPKFPQEGNHPVVNVSWDDAQAYCTWLSDQEGQKYRLPTDHEWSCAVGIGRQEDPNQSPESKSMKIADVFPWGRGKPEAGAGNYMGQEWNTAAGHAGAKMLELKEDWTLIPDYNDGVLFTAAVASYKPNSLGIFDLGGNVWEWCRDKFKPDSDEWLVLRGGGWRNYHKDPLLSSLRRRGGHGTRHDYYGFRVVLDVSKR